MEEQLMDSKEVSGQEEGETDKHRYFSAAPKLSLKKNCHLLLMLQHTGKA